MPKKLTLELNVRVAPLSAVDRRSYGGDKSQWDPLSVTGLPSSPSRAVCCRSLRGIGRRSRREGEASIGGPSGGGRRSGPWAKMESSDEEDDFMSHEWITPQSHINSVYQSHTEKVSPSNERSREYRPVPLRSIFLRIPRSSRD